MNFNRKLQSLGGADRKCLSLDCRVLQQDLRLSAGMFGHKLRNVCWIRTALKIMRKTLKMNPLESHLEASTNRVV